VLRNYIANPYKAATPKVNICSVAFKDQTLPQKKLINKFKPKKLSIKTPLKQKIYEVDETIIIYLSFNYKAHFFI